MGKSLPLPGKEEVMPAPGSSRFTKHLPMMREMLEAGLPTQVIAEMLGERPRIVNNYLRLQGLLALRRERRESLEHEAAVKYGRRRRMPRGPGTPYKDAEPAITEMRLLGVRSAVIASTLGLNKDVLEKRLHDWGLNDLRREREEEIAREIAAKHGLARTEEKGERE